MVELRKLPANRWRDYRNLRLEGLKSEPLAFGSSFEEAVKLKEDAWRKRIKNVMFALSNDRPVGMIAYAFDEGPKTKHIAEIYSFYVSDGHRNEGVGTALLKRALSLIRTKGGMVKARLYVNTEQRAAISLYKKAGFVVRGKLRKELKVGRRFYDMLVMEKMF